MICIITSIGIGVQNKYSNAIVICLRAYNVHSNLIYHNHTTPQ